MDCRELDRRSLLCLSGGVVATSVAGCSILTGNDVEVRNETAKLAADDGDGKNDSVLSAALSGDGTTVLFGVGNETRSVPENTFSAHAFSRVDSKWQKGGAVSADGDSTSNGFGGSVALSVDGTIGLVGAVDGVSPNTSGRAGSAYVFSGEREGWLRRSKLIAADGDDQDEFGESVGLSDDGATALIGAPVDEDPNGGVSGSAYVFSRGQSGWRQRAKLAAADGDRGDYFGQAVALSGDATTALVGAPEDEDPNGALGGSAYVFSRTGRGWRQQTKLVADDGSSMDEFGRSVALSRGGTTALVGARYGNANGPSSGSVYVFTFEDGGWRRQAKLIPSDGDSRDGFGSSVALSGDGRTALVSAPSDESPNGSRTASDYGAGSAYVFGQSEGNWSQRRKLAPADGTPEDGFGDSVALSNDGGTAVVTARTDQNAEDAGSVYVFDP